MMNDDDDDEDDDDEDDFQVHVTRAGRLGIREVSRSKPSLQPTDEQQRNGRLRFRVELASLWHSEIGITEVFCEGVSRKG